jgi:hypothetical protein
LSNINFNDPEDLEIVIPFYTRKIKQIVVFYKQRRDKLKFTVERNKRKTTNYNVEQAIKDNIIDYIFDNSLFTTLNYSYSALYNQMHVQVDDLVDTFGAYLNLAPTPSNYGSASRQQKYTSDFNPITSYNNSNTLFNKVFLKELGVNFTVNVNLNYDPTCQPFNPIGYFITSKTINGVSPSQKNALKQELLQKFIN